MIVKCVECEINGCEHFVFNVSSHNMVYIVNTATFHYINKSLIKWTKPVDSNAVFTDYS